MKKIDITGWKKVFSFTFIQTIKTRSYLITLLIFCLLAAVAVPAFSYYHQDAAEEEHSDGAKEKTAHIEQLKKVYLSYDKNETMDQLFDGWKKQYDCDIEYLAPDQTDSVKDTLNDTSDTCILTITKENGVYSMNVISGWNTKDIYEDIDTISDQIAGELKELQVSSVIAEEYREDAGKAVKAYTDGKESEDNTGYMEKYYLGLSLIVVILFILSFAGQSIANSIIVEKSSKLIEYLMLAVRPMAIVAGKILAVLAGLLIQIAAMVIAGILSALISESFFHLKITGTVTELFDLARETSVLSGLNAGTILLSVLILLSGLLFFSLVASIAGASVSKIEETAEGMVLFTLLLIIGAYMALALFMGNLFTETGQLSGAFAMVCCLLPVSSLFAVPANLIMGSIPLWIGVAALLILIASAVILLILTSRIYEYLLFYQGVTLKPKDIIHIIRYGKVKEDK